MADIVVLPKMNLSMEDGLLAEWLKNEGDAIAIDDVLCSIENEKETAELTSPFEGILVKVLASAGEKYDVQRPLAIIASAGEDWSGKEAEALKMISSTQNPTETIHINIAKASSGGGKMLPKIRKMLRDKGIDAEAIQAAYPNIRITEKEIEAFLNTGGIKQASLKDDGDVSERMSSMRHAVAKAMVTSCEKTARLTNFMEVDMTKVMEYIAREKKNGNKLSVTAVIIKACAKVLGDLKIINSVLDEAADEIIYKKAINIGCAVDVEGGLVVPVIRNADKKSVEEISADIVDYSARARGRKLEAAEREGGTFTVSSIGMYDVDFFTPIINYPQTAILGVGSIKTLPRYADDMQTIIPRKIMTIGITYDHRVIDGGPASRFLLAVRNELEAAELF